MPKRKRDEDDYDYFKKQLRKLKRKIKSGRNRRCDSSSSSCSDSPSHHYPRECEPIVTVNDDVTEPEPGCSYWDDYWPEPSLSVVEDCESLLPAAQSTVATMSATIAAAAPNAAAEVAPLLAAPADAAPPFAASPTLISDTIAPLPPGTVQSTVTVIPSPLPNTSTTVTSVAQTSAEIEVTNPTLDPELLAILGEDPNVTKEYGDDIQNDLAIRLNHLATSGLNKENRTEIKDKYLIPGNCKMIKAPTLNPEIRASLIESQAKRDKGIENKQILNSCAMSSLSKAITLLLASDSTNQEVLKLLMDTARILGDIQHSDSMLRRFFILSTVRKELKDQLEKTKIEDLLFGSNLAETLKSAKTISKTGADMRSSTQTTAKSGAPKPRMPNKPLNSRAPPANRRPAPSGGTRNWRSTNPAPTSRQATTKQHSSSKTSSRHQYPRHRR